MTDFVAEMNQALESMTLAERRTTLRALMPEIVQWYRGSLIPAEPQAVADVPLLLWVEELSAGLIGPLCAAGQEVRMAVTSSRAGRRAPAQQRFPRSRAARE